MLDEVISEFGASIAEVKVERAYAGGRHAGAGGLPQLKAIGGLGMRIPVRMRWRH